MWSHTSEIPIMCFVIHCVLGVSKQSVCVCVSLCMNPGHGAGWATYHWLGLGGKHSLCSEPVLSSLPSPSTSTHELPSSTFTHKPGLLHLPIFSSFTCEFQGQAYYIFVESLCVLFVLFFSSLMNNTRTMSSTHACSLKKNYANFCYSCLIPKDKILTFPILSIFP